MPVLPNDGPYAVFVNRYLAIHVEIFIVVCGVESIRFFKFVSIHTVNTLVNLIKFFRIHFRLQPTVNNELVPSAILIHPARFIVSC